MRNHHDASSGGFNKLENVVASGGFKKLENVVASGGF
jgi:hypothetical protein